jgi:hypothetical protein
VEAKEEVRVEELHLILLMIRKHCLSQKRRVRVHLMSRVTQMRMKMMMIWMREITWLMMNSKILRMMKDSK